jgi:hypothetical protein
MNARTRTGQIVLFVLFALCAVISVSTYVAEDPFPSDAQALISTFGVGFAVLGIVTTACAARSRAARSALWILPAFFVAHVALLGTWLPDAVLAVVSAVAIALMHGGAPVANRTEEPARATA